MRNEPLLIFLVADVTYFMCNFVDKDTM